MIRIIRVAVITLLCTVFISASFCSFAAAWTIGKSGTVNEGWVLDSEGAQYFAIGLWGIPGYTFDKKGNEPSGNESVFVRETAPFNLITIQSGYQKMYMQRPGRAFSSGLSTFYYFLSENGYAGTVPLAVDDDPANKRFIQYKRMRSIRDNLDRLAPYVRDTIVKPISAGFRDVPFIHYIMDEPDTGGRGWYWHPSVTRLYHDIVQTLDDNTLTYIDLGGNIAANRFFYEKAHGDTFLVGTNTSIGECNPENMDTYNVASDGTTLYDFKWSLSGGEWRRKPLEDFRYLFYDNVRETSAAYDSSCDVIGVNSYRAYRDYPETTGEVVDAIKAGCGSGKPVWLFFDAAADQKPRDMSYADYAALVRCQAYTSVIHGATGVNFYAFTRTDEAKEQFWPLMKALAGELKAYSDILRLPVIDAYWDSGYHRDGYSHIHWTVRGDASGNRWLIASNTSTAGALTFTADRFPPMTLGPLEVRVVAKTAE